MMSRSTEWAIAAAVCAAIAVTGVVLFAYRSAGQAWLENVSLSVVVSGVMGCLVFGLTAWVVRK